MRFTYACVVFLLRQFLTFQVLFDKFPYIHLYLCLGWFLLGQFLTFQVLFDELFSYHLKNFVFCFLNLKKKNLNCDVVENIYARGGFYSDVFEF